MSGHRARPDVIVFDVLETLARLDVVAERLRDAGGDRALLDRWFVQLQRDGMALTLVGGYAPFAEVAASALRQLAAGMLTNEQVRSVVDGFRELDPHPDAAPAVAAARDAGMRVVTLSNGAAASTRNFLQRAGIADSVELVLSIEDVTAWKPARAVYEYAVRATRTRADRLAMVAVHSWDLAGAAATGLTTGWCARLEGEQVRVFGQADVVADRLDEVVERLAALPP